MNSFLRVVLATFATGLLLWLAGAIYWSWHWPLVGDAALMHYVVFLIDHGWAPYRQIIDINLPGTYFFEALNMRVFGDGALGSRLYDLTLLLICAVSAFAILTRQHWFAAAFATTIFSLIHIQDGIAQLGQRDLLIAALLASGYSLLIAAKEQLSGAQLSGAQLSGAQSSRPQLSKTQLSKAQFPGRNFTRRNMQVPLLFLLAGFVFGLTVTIKPLYLPVGLMLVAAPAYQLGESSKSIIYRIGAATAGAITPSIVVLAYLHREHALTEFIQTLTGLVPLHASLGRRPFSYLLAHCLSPIEPLVAIWIATIAISRPKLSPLRLELILAAACSAFAYFAQGKAYPYHRYPLLLFLLLLIASDLTSALRDSGPARLLAASGVVFACFFLAPMAAWKAHTFTADTPFESALAKSLTGLGGQQLSGNVQCLDTFGGCINTLYNLKLVQGTGFLYDCYLFTPSQNQDTTAYRNAFWNAYRNKPAQLIVLTSQFCFGADRFDKIDNWLHSQTNFAAPTNSKKNGSLPSHSIGGVAKNSRQPFASTFATQAA